MCKNKVQFQKGLSLEEFLDKYGTQEQCFEALVAMRWRDGFECPKCGGTHFCRINRGKMFQCNKCHSQNSVTAGTIFHSTKLPLTKWFLAIYLITQGKSGISQLELARQIGVSANTGAMLYHKIGQVMLERDSSKKISGKVEIDDAYWGGKKAGKRGRGSKNKIPFIAAVEKNKDGHPTRIKLQVVSGFTKSELKKWSEAHLDDGTSVISDGLNCFKSIGEAGYNHSSVIVGDSRNKSKTVSFNWVNTILGNLKTSLAGTFHKLSKEHLPRHLAIVQYRFNRRFVLGDMIERLTYVSLRTPPMPRRLLKLAENHW